MVNFADLRSATEGLLGTSVTAAALFVIDIGRIKPTAAGLAGAVGADVGLSALGVDDPLTLALASGAGYSTAQHAAYKGSADAAGVTPVMVVATTAQDIVLLDWNGDLRSGSGPTKVLARFPRSSTTVTGSKSGVTQRVVLTQGEVEARLQANLGLIAPGKKQVREVLSELGV